MFTSVLSSQTTRPPRGIYLLMSILLSYYRYQISARQCRQSGQLAAGYAKRAAGL